MNIPENFHGHVHDTVLAERAAAFAHQEREEFLLRHAKRPSTLYTPSVSLDGDMWSALYGANVQEGVCGFGQTPEKALEDFDRNWTLVQQTK